MKRVVVTGMGVVSPVGSGREVFWQGLLGGRSGVGPITLFDVASFPVRIGGQARDVDVAAVLADFPKAARERDRKIPLGLAAAAEALADARLDQAALAEAQIHVGVGLEAFFLEDLTPVAEREDMGAALAEVVAAERGRPAIQTPLNRLGEILGGHYGIAGARYTNCAACAAGAQAIGQALRELQHGTAEVAVAGAADSMLNPLGLGGFSLLRVLSTENEQPERACRPFDASRQGTVLGEGAAFLVLESLEHARRRRARIYAEVLGYGCSMDAFHVSDPEPTGRGAVLAMNKAIRDAGLGAGDIDAINAHGTGTPKNDLIETQALKQVFGTRAGRMPVSAIKSMTGHMIAASGAVEAAASVLSLFYGMVPPTINLAAPDPECDLDYVTEGARQFDGATVLSNSFGFGGHNASLVFGRMGHD